MPFGELRKTTGLSAPTLSSHLSKLQQEGLIELRYYPELDTRNYVITDEKRDLVNLLRYFIGREKTIVKEYSAEMERLERAAGELEEALKPFGKIPVEIKRLQEDFERFNASLSR